MTFREAKREFFDNLLEQQNCRTKQELIKKIGATTIRVCWVDHVDYLRRDGIITEKQAYEWGQVL